MVVSFISDSEMVHCHYSSFLREPQSIDWASSMGKAQHQNQKEKDMTIKYIAALVLAAVAGSGFAAEQAKTAQPQRADDGEVAIRTVDFPTAAFNARTARSRAEVKAEAVEAAKHHQSSLAEQFELLK
jgi:hypothetical protein